MHDILFTQDISKRNTNESWLNQIINAYSGNKGNVFYKRPNKIGHSLGLPW